MFICCNHHRHTQDRVFTYLGGMRLLPAPSTRSQTCSAPGRENILNSENICSSTNLDIGMGDGQRPEEAAEPLDVAALLQGLADGGHLDSGQC